MVLNKTTAETMLVTRANKKGGRPLTGFPIGKDPETDCIGYKLGYCSGCNNPLLLKLGDVHEIIGYFGDPNDWQVINKLSIRQRLIKWLGGKVD